MHAISPDHLNPTGDFGISWMIGEDMSTVVKGSMTFWTTQSTIIAFLTISDRDRLPSPEFP
jgi:hypothetical protein